MDGKKATIAMLDLFNNKSSPSTYNRDQGFLTGMGIDVKDKQRTATRTRPASTPAARAATTRSSATSRPRVRPIGQDRHGELPFEVQEHQPRLLRSTSRPAGGGAEALKDAGVKDAIVVSVDGGCDPGLKLVKDGTIGATSQQYPVKMAELGVEAIKKIADSDGQDKPAVTRRQDFYDTGVALVTDKKVEGVESISVAEGEKLCWG